MQTKTAKDTEKNSLIGFYAFFCLILLLPVPVQAKVWWVGAGLDFTQPGPALARAGAGDTVKIMADTYDNPYATLTQNDLTIIGVGGPVYLKSSGLIPGGKAIWVIRGNHILIRNITFSGARVRDHNGAGIRLESGTLTLDNCVFQNNEMGILTDNKPDISLFITQSRFSRNRQDYSRTGYLSHNIYVGAIKQFTLQDSLSEGAQYGHLVKSRARRNIIRNNRLVDAGDIAASYLIDLPNGGVATIDKNYLHQNKGARNRTLISYGAEGMRYPENKLVITGNRAIDDRGNGRLLDNRSTIPATVQNNQTRGLRAEDRP